MGVYYYYVNDTKRQYFCIDPTGRHIKSYALGRNVGSRALSYLILQNDAYFTGVEPHPLVGSWIGDRIFVTGDDYCPNFDLITAEYADIGQSVIEMLVVSKPVDLWENGCVDWFIEVARRTDGPVTLTAEMRDRMAEVLREEARLTRGSGTPRDPDIERMLEALKAGTPKTDVR